MSLITYLAASASWVIAMRSPGEQLMTLAASRSCKEKIKVNSTGIQRWFAAR